MTRQYRATQPRQRQAGRKAPAEENKFSLFYGGSRMADEEDQVSAGSPDPDVDQ